MPLYKRKYAPKRRLVRRKRLARRPLRLRRAPSTGGFYIKRRMAYFAVQGSTTVSGLASSTNTSVLSLGTISAAQSGGPNLFDIPFSMQFSLNQLDSASDITNIADKYRIVNALVKLTTSNVALGAGAGLVMPHVEYIVDHDDASTPSISQITQKMGVRNVGFNQRGQLAFYCKPKPTFQVYNGVSTAYSIPARSPYLDCNNSDVPHYGIKGILRSVFLPGATNCANIGVDIQMTVHAKDLQ